MPNSSINIAPKASRSAQELKARSKRNTEQPGGNWIMTFTDMMALMLTFFVMTYSMANPKQEVWDDVKEQVNMEFSKEAGQLAERGEVNDISFERIEFDRALDLSYLEALLTTQLSKREIEDHVTLINEGDTNRLILSMPSTLLFTPGKATLSDSSQDILKKLGDILKGVKNSIEIVGHADPSPVTRSNAYRSNWDLSLQRATSVAQALRASGYEHPLHLRGLSNSLYSSLPNTMSETKRLSTARRVDIIIYNKHENFSERLGL